MALPELTRDQREFILLFVLDGEYDIVKSAAALGILPSQARGWFRNPDFQAAVRAAQGAKLASMGYGPLLTMEDTLSIAHSDVTKLSPTGTEGDLTITDLRSLPRHVRVAIKKIKFGSALGADGKVYIYPKEVEMHDKAWALRQAAEWFQVGESPEAKAAQATKGEDGPKRITGLVIRPPLTDEEKELEDLLK